MHNIKLFGMAGILTAMLYAGGGNAATYYVDAAQTNDSGAGTNWATAKQTIQAAVDIATNIDDTVIVTNGTYNLGGTPSPGYALTNRVYLSRQITVRSVNGPTVTTIQGSGGEHGDAAVRGACLYNGASLIGFTIADGRTRTTHPEFMYDDIYGGGIIMGGGCVASNCVLTGNAANGMGGGAYLSSGGTLIDCMVSSNWCSQGGGVLLYNGGTASNCKLIGNSAPFGGGASTYLNGTLNNCVFSGNSSEYDGGGVMLQSGGALNNCTLSGNHAARDGGGVNHYSGGGTVNNCIVWGNTASGSGADIYGAGVAIRNTCAGNGVTDGVDGNITNNPFFADAAAGNYRLISVSPCIDTGANTYAPTNVTPYDIAGSPRIINFIVDMGAYESPLMPAIAVLGTNGVAIASGDPADAEKGTDFGSVVLGGAVTNTFAITNRGSMNLTISGVTTNGAGSAAFEISDLRFDIPGGGVSNFTIRFTPATFGTYTAVVQIANNSDVTPYVLCLAGTGSKSAQAALIFNPASPQTYNTTNALSVSGGSGTGAVSYAVLSGPGQLVGSSNLWITAGTGAVQICATKAADAIYNAIAVTAQVAAAKAGQVITFPAIPDQVTTNRLLLSATASSGLGVSFTNTAGNPVIWENATTIRFSTVGTVSIVAGQTGDTNWNAALSVTNTFDVIKAAQSDLTFIPASPQVYNTTNALSVSGGSGTGAVSYALLSGPGQIAGGSNLLVTSGTGIVVVAATKAADTMFNAAAVTASVVCAKIDQTIAFPAIPDQTVTSVVALSAMASSGLPVTFEVVSGPGVIARQGVQYSTVIHRLLSTAEPLNREPPEPLLAFTGTGMVVVAASQPGNANWTAASVSNTVHVLASGHGALTAVLLPADAVAAGAMWRLDGGGWLVSGEVVTGMTAGVHTVSFNVVAGYTNPAQRVVTIAANQRAAIEGCYVLAAGDTCYVSACADYDGDGKADPGIYRSANGDWSLRLSSSAYNWLQLGQSFGQHGYAPVAADFDGDGKADLGLYNTTNGEWQVMLSAGGYSKIILPDLLGGVGFTALAADFDGDGLADPTVYNPATGDWKVRLSTGGYLEFDADDLLGHTGFAAGAGDFDGDRLADPFVCAMATGQCMALLSGAGYYLVQTVPGFLGAPEWLLALADYDGDGMADPAAYDPATGTLAVRLSAANYQLLVLPEFLKP